ncbi:hypothetical protein PHMEG_0001553 [Phytophthora megakarya]|uniref:E2F/DP family winged-helix DNA-binding domain-containing protein n=1 Tax=Phytophthora megakarya TaxID=4795 RepID=A0A225X2Y9_9STRA|nr:hypothetical protein PHMEG_0001553 [Phytophthora megakarya]
MKNQHARRRKLRFNSIKDVAPVVTVKVECPKQPLKRRKRQQRPRRASPIPSRPTSTPKHATSLPTATWSGIQAQFVAAKSLGEITRTMLQFFKEHEDLQSSAPGPAFPIFVPSSDIYKMKVPRKRRIYDVLHVLEGIGVIKRVRCDETRKTKGGFLYNGKAAVVQHLGEMQRYAAQAMVNFRQSRGLRSASTVEEDCAIVKVLEDLATTEKWPCLVSTTICFLSLLFQEDYRVGVALPNMSARLIEAKKFIGALVPSLWNEASYKDVHRRVYDVVAVLEGCNLIFTSTTLPAPRKSSFDKRNKRKSVVFNYDIFTDSRVLFAVESSDALWTNSSQEEMRESTNAIFSAVNKSPLSRAHKDHLISPPSACWQNLNTLTSTASSLVFSQVDGQLSDAGKCGNGNRKPPPLNGRESKTSDSSWNVQPKYRPPSPCVRVFFSPLGKEPTERNEWYDESLKQLGQYDALPVQDNIDWDVSKQFKETHREEWGQCSSPHAYHSSTEVRPDQVWVDRMEVQAADLEYHGVLVEDTNVTLNFFC